MLPMTIAIPILTNHACYDDATIDKCENNTFNDIIIIIYESSNNNENKEIVISNYKVLFFFSFVGKCHVC